MNPIRENSKNRQLIRTRFHERIIKSTLIAATIFLFSISLGVLGYHYIAKQEWVDAFLNASMILGGMGPVDPLTNDAAKIFAGCYALFSGVAFISSMAIFLTPVIHLFLHKFHVDIDEETKS